MLRAVVSLALFQGTLRTRFTIPALGGTSDHPERLASAAGGVVDGPHSLRAAPQALARGRVGSIGCIGRGKGMQAEA
jgi:hypothetical protein